MKRTPIRSKEFATAIEHYGVSINKKDLVELVVTDHSRIILLNQEPAFFYYGDTAIPTLKYLLQHSLLKTITIDMGAVKFIVNGADLMKPGIKSIESGILKDEPVALIDEIHKKPVAVGIALCMEGEMHRLTSGKVVKNIHYVGDPIWNWKGE